MRQIYLDNGSTSFPKAPGVGEAMQQFITQLGCNINRGSYERAYEASEGVLEVREGLAELFEAPRSKNIIFTYNATSALNMLLKGLIRPGDQILSTSMEHNAVSRPLTDLADSGADVVRIPCSRCGALDPAQLEAAIGPKTRAVVMVHASNVCGTILPIEDVGEICRRHHLYLIVDAAQTAGLLPIRMQQMGIDAVAFAGHKGLLGPQGIGGFAVGDALAAELKPVLSGGSGSVSDSDRMPSFLPDRFEPGTPNLPGIFGLLAALRYRREHPGSELFARELFLTMRMIHALEGRRDIHIAGTRDSAGRTSVLSLDFPDRDNAEISWKLDARFGIMTRCGLHCAPYAHKTLGTYPQGTVRFSPGPFTTEEEIDCAVAAIFDILAE